MAPAPVARPTTLLRMSSCSRHCWTLLPMSSVLAPRWERGLRHWVRAFRNQNSGRARNQSPRIRTQATKETGEMVGWRVVGKQNRKRCLGGKFNLEAVGDEGQETMGLKSLGQEGSPHPLFFRGAMLVGSPHRGWLRRLSFFH